MASIHRQKNRPYYFAAFYDAQGKRVFRSTGTADKKQAMSICRSWEKATVTARNGKLSEDAARAIIAEGVSNLLLQSSGASLPSSTLNDWSTRWLESKKLTIEPLTYDRYSGIVSRLKTHLGLSAGRDLSTITTTQIASFRDSEGKRLSIASANISLKVTRMLFSDAVNQKLLSSSPANGVKILKTSNESSRRALTLAEIKRLLAVADQEWKGILLFGLYTGQRLGDIIKITWRQINLEREEVSLTTQKTKKRMCIPLVKPLKKYLLSLKAGDNPDEPLFPTTSQVKRSGHASNMFYAIMVEAGLVPARNHRKSKDGRAATRTVSEISFHSLRHSAVSMLKASGVNDSMAMAIVGHESEAISRVYTHMTTEDMRRAMEKLPGL